MGFLKPSKTMQRLDPGAKLGNDTFFHDFTKPTDPAVLAEQQAQDAANAEIAQRRRKHRLSSLLAGGNHSIGGYGTALGRGSSGGGGGGGGGGARGSDGGGGRRK